MQQPAPLSARGVDPKRRRHISIVYGEPQVSLGNTVRAALYKEGFQDIGVYTAIGPLRDAISDSLPDLLLLDAAMPGGDACEMVRDVRSGKLGPNPFVPVIFTTWQPTRDIVADIVAAGSDDLLVKPMSPGMLFQRMQNLVDRRKPFIATHDYIGPDRRSPEEQVIGDLPIDVPNTLRAKARGELLDPVELAETIAIAQRNINEQRLARHAMQVTVLVRVIAPAYLAGLADAETAELTERLIFMAADAASRLERSRYAHAAPLCQSLQRVAETIRRDHPEPGAKDLELLPRLADATLAAFNPNALTGRLFEQIAASVESYLDRHRDSDRGADSDRNREPDRPR